MNDTLYQLLSSKILWKTTPTPSQWLKLNGLCCVYNGEKRPDTKHRAGFLMTPDGGVTYHCFNCGFTTRYTPTDHKLSFKMKQLLEWAGASAEEIKTVNYSLYKENYNINQPKTIVEQLHMDFSKITEIHLPADAKLLTEWAKNDNPPQDFIDVLHYIHNRNPELFDIYNFYWSPCKDDGINRRVIMPMYFHKTLVGYTARAIDDNKLRYLHKKPPHFLFNNHVLYTNRKYVIIVEGPLDAIVIDGVATCGAKITKQQAEWINQTKKEVIYLPDHDLKNITTINTCIENKWNVSFPWNDYWERDIKDASDAAKRYGRLYTLMSIIESRTSNELKIKTAFMHMNRF